MPDQIFISYRRDDAAYVTGHINDLLRKEFGGESVFTDVDNIALGVDFRAVLDESVSQCQVLLAVIGDNWLTVRNKDGKPRLHDPADFVRIEVESALKRKIPVIPLLVSGATMPQEEDLPDSLKDLAFRNGTQIRPAPDFNVDMERLVRNLRTYLKSTQKEAGEEQGIQPDPVTSPGEETAPQPSNAEAAVQREAQTDRRKTPRQKILVGEEERARKQAELGAGHQPAKRQRVTRLWWIAILGVASGSWYYADQNPEKIQSLLTAVRITSPETEESVATSEDADADLPEAAVGAPTSFSPAAVEATDAIPEAEAAAPEDLLVNTPEATTEAAVDSVASLTADDAVVNVAEDATAAADEMVDGEVILTPGTKRQADASEFINEGVSLAALGDHEAAVRKFDEALQLDVEPAFVFKQRAASHRALGDYEAAVSDYSEAIQLDGEDVNAYYNRGALNFALEDYPAAVADYDAVIQLDPELADAYSKRADAHEALGNADEAARDRATAAVFEQNRE